MYICIYMYIYTHTHTHLVDDIRLGGGLRRSDLVDGEEPQLDCLLDLPHPTLKFRKEV